MAKSGVQLKNEGFEEFFYFGRKFFFLCLGLLTGLILAGAFLYGSLVDPNIKFEIPEYLRCRTKGCGAALIVYSLIFLFLALPVWIKFTSAGIVALNFFLRLGKRLLWYLDTKPDLAMGPCGLYFPANLSFRQLAWDVVHRVELVKAKSKNGKMSEPTLNFFGEMPTVRSLTQVAPLTAPLLLRIPPDWGFNTEAVVRSVKQYAPSIKIDESIL